MAFTIALDRGFWEEELEKGLSLLDDLVIVPCCVSGGDATRQVAVFIAVMVN
jgi:hypothetical protein